MALRLGSLYGRIEVCPGAKADLRRRACPVRVQSVNANLGFFLTVVALVAAGVVLVVTEHYGWAWIPWLAMFCVNFKDNPPDAAKSPQSQEK